MPHIVTTLDEVVSANVHRLRERRGYSVARLADRLGVSRGTVYHYEQPRRDGRRHSFKWAEMFRLCAVLECSVFELVLPGEGVKVDERVPFSGRIEWDLEALDSESRHLLGALDSDALEMVDPPELGPIGRDEMARVAFHMPAEVLPGRLDELAEKLSTEVRLAAARDREQAVESLIEALRAFGVEGETE